MFLIYIKNLTDPKFWMAHTHVYLYNAIKNNWRSHENSSLKVVIVFINYVMLLFYLHPFPFTCSGV